MEQPGSEKILEADMIFLALGFLGGPVFGGWGLVGLLLAPETNSKFAPENGPPPGKEDSYWKPSFLGAFAVSFRDCFFLVQNFRIF